MPAPRLSAQEYIQQLRAQRAQKTAGSTPAEPAQNLKPTASEATPVTPTVQTEPVPAVETAPPQSAPTPTTNTAPTPGQTDQIPVDTTPVLAPPPTEKVVLEWKAPNRPYKKRNKRYYFTTGTIVFLISLILFFAGQFLPIAVVISVAFVSYVLSAVPPAIVNHQLTNFGLRIDDELYLWTEMGRFWITKRFNQDIVNIEIDRFPWRLSVLLGDLPTDKMTEMFGAILVQETPKPTLYDQASEWLQKMIPLDNV